ncbi:L-tyrosine/L-tryptophan isonitrile synthase family protein [Candidatus Roizmanbacteria bacterium]|nr:L-tyrosine/L-tryptophan isonitrile synthase family protein [Candidatus Roizmanbacteria bacterium]
MLPHIAQNIDEQVKKDLPLHFAVIAIAHKNPRNDQCGGSIVPDIAELGFLYHLKEIIEGIQLFYPPGATFTILTEGGFYRRGGIFDVEAEVIKNYESHISYLAGVIGESNIKLFSLEEIVGRCPNFEDIFLQIRASLNYQEFAPYFSVMQRSITEKQENAGITPEEMAKSYVALHRAKHAASSVGRSLIYEYLEEVLGPNFIYCSVTGSNRLEVLNIDIFNKPSILPQHGIGVLQGGTSKIVVTPFSELQLVADEMNLGAIICQDMGPLPFGAINFGGK